MILTERADHVWKHMILNLGVYNIATSQYTVIPYNFYRNCHWQLGRLQYILSGNSCTF